MENLIVNNINYIDIPKYTESDFLKRISEVTPIQEYDGFLVKRDDLFNLNGISGGKVRQCMKLVHDNLDLIRDVYDGGLITATNLLSPQSVIVSVVAKYFGLKAIITVPIYSDHLRDYNRINVSLAQKFGATVYGVGNTNMTGPEKDAKELEKQIGYYRVKFGMNGRNVMDTVSNQVENIPDKLENLVMIGGSGLSALGVLTGIQKFKKQVDNVYIITLSGYTESNKKLWYDTLPEDEKYIGNLHIIKSKIPYQKKYKINNTFDFDLTYESKAYQWMIDNIEPSTNTLFWVVGKKIYDLSYIEKINWHKSEYEKQLDIMRYIKSKTKFIT